MSAYFVVFADKSVNGPDKTYPPGSRIRIGQHTAYEDGEFVLSRTEASQLVEMNLGWLDAAAGSLLRGSSAVPVAVGE